jgi:hypothetical protein
MFNDDNLVIIIDSGDNQTRAEIWKKVLESRPGVVEKNLFRHCILIYLFIYLYRST